MEKEPAARAPRKHRKLRRLVSAILTLLLFVYLFVHISYTYRGYEMQTEFYGIPKNSLDVVFFGTSITFSGILPMELSVVTYGAPVLPGAMFLLAYYGNDRIPVMGLPGCVMYAKRTIFDLVLPRVMAGEILSKEDFDKLGQGGLCLGCDVCTFPNCGFGK